MIEAAAELSATLASAGEIVALRWQAQQRQAAVVAAADQRRQRRLGARQHGVELSGGDAARPDGLGEASGNVLAIGHGAQPLNWRGTLSNASLSGRFNLPSAAVGRHLLRAAQLVGRADDDEGELVRIEQPARDALGIVERDASISALRRSR